MSNVLFIGDMHFGHQGVAKWRNLGSSPEHDEELIRRWNLVVNKRDIVWILGDVAFRTTTEYVKSVFLRLSGTKFVILGNHDSPKQLHDAGFSTQYGMMKKYGFWMTHAPIHPLELRGSMNMHGHVHGNTLPDDRYLNVSAEVINYYPVPLEEIRRMREEGYHERYSRQMRINK